MPIQLGLQRMVQLLKHLGNPHETFCAIQVAGTNGKGSICSYIYTTLLQAAIKTGRYTSPHFFEPRDTIHMNGRAASKEMFETCYKRVMEIDKRFGTNATEFELLTATAFECFCQAGVRVAVIETGLGGRLDATNVFESPLLSVISRIGKDHEAFLGNTLEAIAREKGGIFRENVPCVIDITNKSSVLRELEKVAQEVHAGPVYLASAKETNQAQTWSVTSPSWGTNDFQTSLNGSYQGANVACGVYALDVLTASFPLMIPHAQNGIKNTIWPGRLDFREIPGVGKVLFDGAHNQDAAIELANFVNLQREKNATKSVSWMVAFTNSKDAKSILDSLVHPGDTVYVTQFSSVHGMPWIQSMDSKVIQEYLSKKQIRTILVDPKNKKESLCSAGSQNPLSVVCGSLYLLGDMYKILNLE
ncbi:folylpolyglutamate synthase [Schizosaccharomyces cryophilus OY26]|uniref:Dihydrofolate synthetase n=1 Tax=Schizosaccharomyces cryophilus (strain OY26 / ATCC MYA-4695 / CBS 11777 / NBRC 106824 / NRRL Y48691) TaxID=653667 RepID=S9VNU8_SCHCR|nr:folylpolyglutamate synthase [Schizosaccharomyces cryophilus OY26]EPY49648.1 folylpolyglutamate synthase [Schizosaccharomyces cryophilus OY26]